jgi:AbrB family looped-hinge helix DNA binding protein
MSPITVTVSSKGQMILPAAIRKELGIAPGTKVSVRVEAGKVILDPQNLEAKMRRIKSMRGITAGGPPVCDELLEDRRRERERELREEGW